MSFHYLQSLFNPKSIAVVGASGRPRRIGNVLMRNLLAGGFDGAIMPVNHRCDAVAGVLTYPDLDALPRTPDLAILCTPAPTIPGLIAQLGRRGTRAAIVMAGYLDTTLDKDGRPYSAVISATAREHGVRLLGGSTLGIMVPRLGLNATFSQVRMASGQLGFVSQSDAVGTMVLDWALPKKIGFSHFVSLGDALDIGFGEMLDFLGSDPETRAILLYIESIRERRSFMAAARAAARNKPVLAIKAGRMPRNPLLGVADPLCLDVPDLIGDDDVYDAVLRRAGILRVNTLDQLFDAVETVVRARPLNGNRLVTISNGGGAGMMVEDSLYLGGYSIQGLGERARARLERILPRPWDGRNPIDVRVDGSASRYVDVLKVLVEEREADAILVMHSPNALTDSSEIAQALIDTQRKIGGNLLACWFGDESVADDRQRFLAAGIPTFDTPEHAANAFLHMANHRCAREVLMQVPPSVSSEFAPDTETARSVVRTALAEGRTQLSEQEAKSMLAAYGLRVVPTHVACTPDEAAEIATQIGLPVAVTVMSRDIRRKWDVGGVALNLETADAVRTAALGMLERVTRLRPGAAIGGFTVQRMVERGTARPLLVGVVTDAVFGPLLAIGEGGRGRELYRDIAVGLPPLNLPLAQDLITRSRVDALLDAHHGLPAADREALALALTKISQLIVDIEEIDGLDINPLFVDTSGVIVVDAHIRISASEPTPHRLAILPYPKALEETGALRDGRPILLRPIRPEDETAHYAFLSRLTQQDIVYRFFHYVDQIPRRDMARLTQIDYDREMAFIATAKDAAGEPETLGVVRVVADPDNLRGEFAIVVRSDLKGQGLGPMLMRKTIAYARQRGIRYFTGDVMAENQPMLALLRKLGFRTGPADEPGIVRATLDLQEAPAPA